MEFPQNLGLMPKKIYLLIAVLVVVVLVTARFIFFRQKNTNEVSTSRKGFADPVRLPLEGTAPPLEDNFPDDIIVAYTDNGFNPGSLTVKKGKTVIFKNDSSRDFWPASAVHPAHDAYPEKGGCINSKFDACNLVLPGGIWRFTFNFPGTWKYHDHLSPRFNGTIVVK